MKTISIIIPAYNEERYIGDLLKRILAVDTDTLQFKKEIIVVDDGSKDNTSSVVSDFKEVTLIQQKNTGKGGAVQNGIRSSTGDYILVQDADLEYFPEDYPAMLEELNKNPDQAIYGSRTLWQYQKKDGMKFFPGRHKKQEFAPWLAGIILTLWTFILYQKWITDTLTAYKIYPSHFFKKNIIKTNGFETDHEITSKLIKSNIKIFEVPIRYIPRTKAEGKKIGPKDGFNAVWTLLRFRFSN
ncbi:glycosyltransferase, group 2 family protein [Bacteriovorax sp. BSW11_IV]|uniref:glycosyltransferase family 2 protein n=1 Tax=Bacteriovorax sp. BSW11_IV TaxID=1353529 RepID=UPI00038A23DC|nr:glycosyltransferase family 2 protein [Bacteriovorax sp. BSW11_IV]EQC45853.1 glycosyltransferase, group 2 family protein [Bacteriovorax sp. BSW11_IV]